MIREKYSLTRKRYHQELKMVAMVLRVFATISLMIVLLQRTKSSSKAFIEQSTGRVIRPLKGNPRGMRWSQIGLAAGAKREIEKTWVTSIS
jgi:hypothetical protein